MKEFANLHEADRQILNKMITRYGILNAFGEADHLKMKEANLRAEKIREAREKAIHNRRKDN